MANDSSSSSEEFVYPPGVVSPAAVACAKSSSALLARSSAPAVSHDRAGDSPGKPWNASNSPSIVTRSGVSLGTKRHVQQSTAAIRDAMRAIASGVEVRDVKLKLRTYAQSFAGADSVAWLVARYAMGRDDALVFCQQLLDDGIMKCVSTSGASVFVDSSDALYQWVESSPHTSPRMTGRGAMFGAGGARGVRSRASAGGALGLSSSPPPSSSPSPAPVAAVAAAFDRTASALSALPSIQPRKRAAAFLMLGRDVSREVRMLAPRFVFAPGDNALLASKELGKLDHLKCVSLRALGLPSSVFVLCMGSGVRRLRLLEQLDLSDNDLGAAGVMALLRGWEAPALREVLLSKTSLQSGDDDLPALLALLLRPGALRLRLLDLTRNSLGEASAPLLAQHLAANDVLTTLFLDDNPLTPAAVQLLVLALTHNVALKVLSLISMLGKSKQRSSPTPRLFAQLSSSRLLLEGSGDGSASSASTTFDAVAMVVALLRNTSLTSLCVDTALVDSRDSVPALSRALAQNALLGEASVALAHRNWTYVPASVCALLHVQHLDLSHNNLDALPWSLVRMQLLETLNVASNALDSDALPVHLALLPRLRALDLTDNPIVAALPATLNWRNVNELLKYFRHCCEGTFTCHQMRAMVLGDTRTGRTSVAQRLLRPTVGGGAAATSTSSSAWSSFSHSHVTIAEVAIDPRVSLQVWDFSAEIVQSPTHQFFVLSDSIFVVVFSFANAASVQRVGYWVDLLLGKLATVHLVLVGTHAERCANHPEILDQLRLRYRNRDGLSLHSVLAVNNTARTADTAIWESLHVLLASVARADLRAWVGASFPLKVKYLRSLLAAERALLAVPVMSIATLRTMAAAVRIHASEMEQCFSYLQYSAAALFFDAIARLKDMVVIDPLWLVRVMVAIAARRAPLLTAAEFAATFPLPFFTPSSVDAILALLEGFSMIHAFRNPGHESDTKLVIPFLLAADEPPLRSDERAIIASHPGHTYQRVYEVTATLHGLFDQLFIRLMHVTTRHCSFWRNGFVFMLESPLSGWDVLVAHVTNSPDGLSRIAIDITSSDRSGRLLHIISTTVESLVRAWFPGSHMRRIVRSVEHELDLDVLGEALMSIASINDLRAFSKTVLKECQAEIPDVLLNHTKRIQWRDLRDLKELGGGAFGTVLKATYNDMFVAVKQIRSADMMSLTAPQAFALFLQECWAMNFLEHAKVITLIGVCFQPMSMVLEFMEEGDLRHFLDSHAALPWPLRIALLGDIAEGMAYAHGQWPPIIHKDLK